MVSSTTTAPVFGIDLDAECLDRHLRVGRLAEAEKDEIRVDLAAALRRVGATTLATRPLPSPSTRTSSAPSKISIPCSRMRSMT